MYGQMTSSEVSKATHAAGYLYEARQLLGMDPVLAAKLETLLSDLRTEIEDRRQAVQNDKLRRFATS